MTALNYCLYVAEYNLKISNEMLLSFTKDKLLWIFVQLTCDLQDLSDETPPLHDCL